MDHSETLAAVRRDRRRRLVVDEALEHAVQIIGETGVGSLTISEMARRMGLRAPSLYRYFDSLTAVYDLLFDRGQSANADAVAAAIHGADPGVDRIRAGTRATVRWCVENPALAQLLYWRVVPGFEPSATTMAKGLQGMRALRSELAAAVERGELDPGADSDEAVRLLTVQMSGLMTQHLANEPRARFEDGSFTALTDLAVQVVLDHYFPRRI